MARKSLTPPRTAKHRTTARQRLALWLLFGVILALLPLVLDWLRLIDEGAPHGLASVCADGELLLISAVIAGGSAGELILADIDQRWVMRQIWCGGSTLFMLAIEAGWYSDIAAKASGGQAVPEATVMQGSLVAFVLTVLASGSCVYIGAVGSRR